MRTTIPLLMLALPLLVGAHGNCKYALDYTETLLVTDPVERIEITVDLGLVDAVAYERDGVFVKRHTFGFQSNLGAADYGVEDGVMHFEAHCRREGQCDWEHILELPPGVDLDIDMLVGDCDLGRTDGEITVNLGEGFFRGVRLASPRVTVRIGEGDVDLDHAAAPELVDVEIDDGSVALAVPPGTYRCDLVADDGEVAITGVECDDAATAELAVHVRRGDIVVTAAEP